MKNLVICWWEKNTLWAVRAVSSHMHRLDLPPPTPSLSNLNLTFSIKHISFQHKFSPEPAFLCFWPAVTFVFLTEEFDLTFDMNNTKLLTWYEYLLWWVALCYAAIPWFWGEPFYHTVQAAASCTMSAMQLSHDFWESPFIILYKQEPVALCIVNFGL